MQMQVIWYGPSVAFLALLVAQVVVPDDLRHLRGWQQLVKGRQPAPRALLSDPALAPPPAHFRSPISPSESDFWPRLPRPYFI